MMNIWRKTGLSMTRSPRSTLSAAYDGVSDDLSSWEIVEGSLSDDDGVCSFDGDDASVSDSGDLAPLTSDEEDDRGVKMEVGVDLVPDQVVSVLIPVVERDQVEYGGNDDDDAEEEGACESRDLAVHHVLSLLSPDMEPGQLEDGDGCGNGNDDAEEGASESSNLVPLVMDAAGAFVPRDLVAMVVERDQLVYDDVYGNEDDYVEEEEDLYDEDDVDDELMPWKFKDRFGKQRIKKIGKKGGSNSKMMKSKRMPYYSNRPGCIYQKARTAYL